MKKIKKDLLGIFDVAINSVSGTHVVKKEMSRKQYTKKYHVVAIGKAADAMVQGLPPEKIIDGLLISKYGHISEKLQQDSRFICIESDHPIPNKASISAGKSLINYLETLAEDSACLFLISGGASALVEVLQDGWSLEDLSQLTDYLLANSYSINEINAIRKKASKIKGGGLWNYCHHLSISCLIISDVPNDDPLDIGSGLLFPATDTSLADLPLQALPQKWASRIKLFATLATTKANNDFNWKIIASLSDAKQAAADHAQQLGYHVKIMPNFLQGNAENVAKDCVKTLCKQAKTVYIWGGETTVTLPDNPGRGGRNQHLALAAAIQMKNTSNCFLLAAGTDGSDGLSTATGALVDSDTVNKAQVQGLDAADFLKNADSNSFFVKTNEVIVTGATGTNVMDLLIGISV